MKIGTVIEKDDIPKRSSGGKETDWSDVHDLLDELQPGQVLEISNISPLTVSNAIKEGRLRAKKVTSRGKLAKDARIWLAPV